MKTTIIPRRIGGQSALVQYTLLHSVWQIEIIPPKTIQVNGPMISWDLSDRIGLTQGRISSANNRSLEWIEMCIGFSLFSSSREHRSPAGGYVGFRLGSNSLSLVATVCHITYLRCQLYATTNCHITYIRCQLYVASNNS
jgi:hypothetical protein